MNQLTRIPEEILVLITEQVGDTDILSLRKVSAKTKRCARDAFLDRFYTDRVHLYTQHSLQALVNMSKHEEFKRKNAKKRLQRLEIRVVKASLRNPEGNTQRQSPRLENHRQETEERCTALLAEALVNLAAQGPLPKLSFQDYDKNEREPYGMATMERNYGHIIREYQEARAPLGCGLQAALGLCLTAIFRAQRPITSLDLGAHSQRCAGFHEPLTRAADLRSQIPLTGFATSLASVTTFSVVFSPICDLFWDSYMFNAGPHYTQIMVSTLGLMPALKSLTLKVYPMYDRRKLRFSPQFVPWVPFDKYEDNFVDLLRHLQLETLVLIGPLQTTETTIKRFLSMQKRYLRRLDLQEVEIRSSTHCSELFHKLATEFQLNDMALLRFGYIDDEDKMHRMPYLEDAPANSATSANYRFKGEDAAREFLERLAQLEWPEWTETRWWDMLDSREPRGCEDKFLPRKLRSKLAKACAKGVTTSPQSPPLSPSNCNAILQDELSRQLSTLSIHPGHSSSRK